MRKSSKLILMAVISLTLMTGCKTINEGIIVDKEYYRSYTVTTMMMVGKTMVPTTQYHPARWYITIEGELEGQVVERTMSVGEQKYNEYEVGDYFSTVEERRND